MVRPPNETRRIPSLTSVSLTLPATAPRRQLAPESILFWTVLVGTAIRLVAAGTCSVTASQEGDSRYAAAEDSIRTFAIVAGISRVTIGAIGPRTTATPPFGISATSAANLRIIVTAAPANVCAATGTEISMAGVGECVVTAAETADGIHLQGTPAYARFPVLAAPAFAGEWE